MSLVAMSGANAKDVTVEVQKSSDGAPVTRSSKYQSHVTLYIENADGTKTPSGWSTRVSDGAAKDSPFAFQPGVGLIEGWTEGVLQMKEGERSWLHVPSEKGYGARPMGSQGGAFYIPANSDLLFDIEVSRCNELILLCMSFVIITFTNLKRTKNLTMSTAIHCSWLLKRCKWYLNF